jgi:hypothetical protein
MEVGTYESNYDHRHDVTLQELKDIANTDKRIAIRCGEKYKPISGGHKVEFFYDGDVQGLYTVVRVDEPRDYCATPLELNLGEKFALGEVFRKLLTAEGKRDFELEYRKEFEEDEAQRKIGKTPDSKFRMRALEMEWPGAKHPNQLYAFLRKSYADKVMGGLPLKVFGLEKVVEISPGLDALL